MVTVKRCPTCNRTFNEEHLSFCIDDGTPLVAVVPPDDETTVVRSNANDGTAIGHSHGSADQEPTPYQPPSYVPPAPYNKKSTRAWPWVLGIFGVLFIVFLGLGIAAVALLPRLMRTSNANRNANVDTNVERRNNSNANDRSGSLNSNSNANLNSTVSNSNSTTDENSAPAPTDKAEVLSALTDIEHDWTVANINADKKKLDEILADDYVGVTNGRAQGKAEYLKTVERDTVIQKWSFEDLKVDLSSDRATLTGILRVELKDEQGEIRPGAFRFTDKFVWRDGRWQATGSEVKILE
jgi:hypothetical protein